MKNTKNTIKTLVESINTTCKDYAKEERESNFNAFKENTLKALSKGNNLSTKESNVITSAYGIKNAFINSLKMDKKETLEDLSDVENNVVSKFIAFASKQVASELKALDNAIYSTYEPLKIDNYDAFNECMKTLIAMTITKDLYKFIRAYMFTTDKALSKKAYVKKFVDLFTALKEVQGTYSLKFENVTLKRIYKEVVVTNFNTTNYTYEDLKAFVMDTPYKNELVNNDMVKDTKVLRKALKNALVLTSEEMDVYHELFQ